MARPNYPWLDKTKQIWYVWYRGEKVNLGKEKEAAFQKWHRLELGEEEVPPRGPTVAEVVDAYLSQAETQLKPSTMTSKRKVLGRLREDLGSHVASSLDAKKLLEWLGRQKGWGRSYRWLARNVVRTTFKEIAPDVCKLKLPGPKSRGADQLMTPEQHEKLLKRAPDEYRDALEVLLWTGCRPGAIVKMEARHVNLSQALIILDEHKTDAGGKVLIIHLQPRPLEILTRLVREHPEGQLFRCCRGGPMREDYIRNWIWRARKRLGMERVVAYGYRHAFATDALAEGVPEAQVASLLGHSGTAMLHKHYSHLGTRSRELKEALKKIRPE